MRLRASYIVVVVLALVGGLILYAVMQEPRAGNDVGAAQLPSASGGGASGIKHPAPSLPPVDQDQAKVPKIEVETTEFDFGRVPNNEPTTKEMLITNSGQMTLEISDVTTSCGCTMPAMEDKSLEPGESVPLKITVYPDRIHDFSSRKMLTIMSNASNSPAMKVFAKAEIEPEYSLEPREINLGEFSKGETKQSTVILRQVGEEPVDLLELKPPLTETPGLGLAFELKPEDQWTSPGKKEYVITVTVGPEAAIGLLKTSFMVITNCKRVPKLRCGVSGDIKAFYSYTPSRVSVSLGRHTERTAVVGRLTVQADREFELTDLAVTGADLLANAKPGETPNTMIVELTLTPGAVGGRKDENLSFTVKSGDESFANVVPVKGYLREVL